MAKKKMTEEEEKKRTQLFEDFCIKKWLFYKMRGQVYQDYSYPHSIDALKAEFLKMLKDG